MSEKDSSEVVALSKFRAALARARTTHRADAILSDPDADRLIPTLPIQDLYLAIKDVGLADAEELVARASAEQLQGFVDLDTWDRDELSVEKLRPWIEVLQRQGFEKLAQAVEGLDPEVVALYVMKNAAVYDLEEDSVPEEPEGVFYPTPDRFYLLDIKTGGEDGKSFQQFVDDLYRADLALGRKMMMGARWEVASDLEEWAYRFRQGRLADLGFPDPEEAMAIYRPLDPATVKIPDVGDPPAVEPGVIAVAGVSLPALVADAIEPRSLLAQALGTLTTDAEIERVHASLVTLFNRALAADRVEPADLAAGRLVLEDMIAYIGLGLEYLARTDVERAARAMKTLPLERIFRAGFSLTASLARLAETLFLRGRVRVGTPATLLLDGRHREVLSALRNPGTRGRRPRMPRMLDTPPAGGTRPFRSAADIRLAAAAIASAARVPVFFFDDLGLSVEAVAEAAMASPGFTFGTLARTLAARILLDGKLPEDPAPKALRPPEVGALLARLRERALTAEDQAEVGRVLLARVAARGRTAPVELEAWFDEWFADLGRRVAEVEGLYVTA